MECQPRVLNAAELDFYIVRIPYKTTSINITRAAQSLIYFLEVFFRKRRNFTRSVYVERVL